VLTGKEWIYLIEYLFNGITHSIDRGRFVTFDTVHTSHENMTRTWNVRQNNGGVYASHKFKHQISNLKKNDMGARNQASHQTRRTIAIVMEGEERGCEWKQIVTTQTS
jgi:hypothetical protein